jgi:hypothetical protein
VWSSLPGAYTQIFTPRVRNPCHNEYLKSVAHSRLGAARSAFSEGHIAQPERTANVSAQLIYLTAVLAVPQSSSAIGQSLIFSTPFTPPPRCKRLLSALCMALAHLRLLGASLETACRIWWTWTMSRVPRHDHVASDGLLLARLGLSRAMKNNWST